MRPLRRIVPAALLLAAVMAPSASAHFPQHVDAAVAPNSELRVTSSALPPTAQTATITVAPVKGSGDKFFDKLANVMSTGTRGQGVVLCAVLYGLVAGNVNGSGFSFSEADPALAVLLLKVCLHMALTLGSPPTARTAAAGCPRRDLGVPVKITRSGGRYRVRATGPATKAKRPPVIATCKRKGHGIQIRLRTRSRKQTLRKLIGTKLAMGYFNPADGKQGTVRTTFAVP